MRHRRPLVRSWPGLAAAALAAALVSGCAGDMSDLEAYIAETYERPAPEPQPLPEFAEPEGYRYPADPGRSPFDPGALARPEVDADEPVVATGPVPDFQRPREPLEGYPLDALRMVGTLGRDRELYALVRDPEGRLHRVATGHYIGDNHGRVVRIGPDGVGVRELVPDGQGGWREEEATLALE